MLTLDFLLKFSFRKLNLSFFTSFRRIIKFLILRRRDFLQHTELERIVIRSCENCNGLNKKCRVKKKSNKYVKCVYLDRKCDLIFSAVE